MKSTPFFALDQSFLDPQKDEKGKPFGPTRYQQIVKECWFISKNINTSYNEVLEISPLERTYLVNFIVEEMEKKAEAIEKAKDESERKRHKR